MPHRGIQDIEGLGPRNAERLAKVGIKHTDALLEQTCNRGGRRALADRTGLSEKVLLKWANMCDLFRINGVAGQYAELLEAAGVDTVKELRRRDPERLSKKMAEVNRERHLTRQVPSAKMLAGWIEQAKHLPPKITH